MKDLKKQWHNVQKAAKALARFKRDFPEQA